jgi:hypoxanthine phosphoribosyltransferase
MDSVAPARVLLDRADLQQVARRLAREIEGDFPEGVVVVGVLKGALLFLADLVRALERIPVLVDFLAISRYAPDSGRVRIVHDVELDLTGRDVVVVEDLVDTGLTLAYLIAHLERLGARRVEVCTMLDRTARRIVPVSPRYVGVAVDEGYVLGCGLHHRDRYRNLPVVLEVDRAAVLADADAYRAWYTRPEVRRDRDGTLVAESEATA